MGTLKMESMDYPCKKLGGIAHVHVEYFCRKDRRFMTGFECDRANDCGISRSPFSGTFNYTVQCPNALIMDFASRQLISLLLGSA